VFIVALDPRMICVCAEPLLHDPSAFPRMLFVERAQLLVVASMRANDHLRFDNIFARS